MADYIIMANQVPGFKVQGEQPSNPHKTGPLGKAIKTLMKSKGKKFKSTHKGTGVMNIMRDNKVHVGEVKNFQP